MILCGLNFSLVSQLPEIHNLAFSTVQEGLMFNLRLKFPVHKCTVETMVSYNADNDKMKTANESYALKMNIIVILTVSLGSVCRIPRIFEHANLLTGINS